MVSLRVVERPSDPSDCASLVYTAWCNIGRTTCILGPGVIGWLTLVLGPRTEAQPGLLVANCIIQRGVNESRCVPVRQLIPSFACTTQPEGILLIPWISSLCPQMRMTGVVIGLAQRLIPSLSDQ